MMNYKQIAFIFLVISCIACGSKKDTTTEQATSDAKDTVAAEPYYIRMADSEMKRNPDPRLIDFREKPKWGYTNGLICTAFLKVWHQSEDEKYLDYVKFFADSMITDEGKILTYKKSDFNIDKINSGKFLFEMYKITGNEKYKTAIETLRDQMREHPRTTEGGFWHKKRYPHQMWLDGLYMGSPFLAQYAATFDEPALFDDVANQIYLVDKYTWNADNKLFYHAWDESKEQKWSDPETGRSPHAWGRAMGWFSMAIVDVLDFLPQDHPKYKVVLDIQKKMADAIINSQDSSGLWWQVLDMPGEEGNYLEASASGMFTYFLLKSVNKGYLSDAKYEESGKKGYEALVKKLIRENKDGSISLTQICGVAGLGGNPYRDGSYDYYINEIVRDDDPKGVGPFIMASLEYNNLK